MQNDGRQAAGPLLANALRTMPEWDRDALIDVLVTAVDALNEVVIPRMAAMAGE
jgi:hypothetical protein